MIRSLIRLYLRWQTPCLLALLVLTTTPLAAQENRNLSVAAAAPVATEKRVALIIGNSAYRQGPLKNPVNDAADVAAKLRGLGFDVIERKDLKISHIGRTLREFRSKLSGGGVALFFYAGHGLQIGGENYLPAVDADIEGEEDVPNQSIAVRQVMELMEGAKTRLNLAFLDACRNNPYARSFRSAGNGLARVSAPSGTLISFATRPGSVAADGSGRNGLYTTHLLTAMETPNQPVELMLKQVTSGVKADSRGAQEPWMEGSIEGNFYFRRVRQEPVISAAEAEKARKEAIERAVQEAVQRNNEQAARERAELQASMQKLIEQAMARRAATTADAGAQASQSSSRERGELQAAMQKLNELEQALARQNAMLEEQRKAGQERANSTANDPEIATGLPGLPSGDDPERDKQDVAIAVSMAGTISFGGETGPRTGDQWEYAVQDRLFAKNHKLVWRVKNVTSNSVVEELDMDSDARLLGWVFDQEPYLIGIPSESGFFLGPHWKGEKFSRVAVVGFGDCAFRLKCHVTARRAGSERVTVPAGTFDAVRIDGTIESSDHRTIGQVTFWYLEKEQRIVKQVVQARSVGIGGYNVDESIELQAIRRTPR